MPRGKGGVVALGDAVVDAIVEAADLPVRDDDVPARITLGLGGQAANVAAWCSHLGAPAAVIAPVAGDQTGRFVREALAARGVRWLGPAVPSGRSGAVVSVVTPAGTRTMLSDRGVSAGLGAGSLRAEWFTGVEWLHLSGYAVFGAGSSLEGTGAAVAAARLAREAGARVSVDLSSAVLLRSAGRTRVADLLAEVGAEVVFGNEVEQEALGSVPVPVLVVKRGAAGCRIIIPDGSQDLPAAPGAVVRDTTGAGDAFAAGWLVGGVDLALEAARACVALAGAMPPPAT